MTPASMSISTVARQDQVSRVNVDQNYGRANPSSSSSFARASDQVDFSSEARQAAEVGGPVRFDLVTRVREQIAKGTYETPDKAAIAAHELTRAVNEQG